MWLVLCRYGLARLNNHVCSLSDWWVSALSSCSNTWPCLQTGICVFQGRRKLLQGEPIHRLLFGSHYQVRHGLVNDPDLDLCLTGTDGIFACVCSTSGRNAPESSLFSATINAGSFQCEFSCSGWSLSEKRRMVLTLKSLPVLLFCIFHHAHILEKHACYSMMSRFGLAFGVAAALGAFVAGNCNVSTAPSANCTRTDAFQVD